jgi:hypothetical protein
MSNQRLRSEPLTEAEYKLYPRLNYPQIRALMRASRDPGTLECERISDDELLRFLHTNSSLQGLTSFFAERKCSPCGGWGFQAVEIGNGETESYECEECGGAGILRLPDDR